MPTITTTISLPRLHAGQVRLRDEAARFNVAACGRRFGKTVFCETELVQPALAGEPVAWFAPTYRMLAEVWRDIRATLLPVTAHVLAQEHRIELVTDGVVDMWSLDNPDAIRGRAYRRVVIDESGVVPDLEAKWLEVIRPTLTDLKGDAWFPGTPKGRNGFWRLWLRGQDQAQDEWRSWRMPTIANPHIDPAEVGAARRGMPERVFAQEYMAAFLEDGGGVFRRITQAARCRPQDGPEPGHVYVAGVDWGKMEDFTVLSVVDATTREQVALERFNRIDYHVQMGRLRALQERWRCARIKIERNSMGEPLFEQAARDGLPVEPFLTTNATKTALIDALALAFEQDALGILDDPVQRAELEAYEMERLPSGLLRYSAPSGAHDDTVMALALAWSLANAPAAIEHSADPEPPQWQQRQRGNLFWR